jgi:hypothetical protein
VARRAGIDRRAAVGCVLGDVWRDIEVAQFVDEAAAARSMVPVAEPRPRPLAVTILGQCIPDVGELGRLTFALHHRLDHVERFFLRSLPVTLRKKLQPVGQIHYH